MLGAKITLRFLLPCKLLPASRSPPRSSRCCGSKPATWKLPWPVAPLPGDSPRKLLSLFTAPNQEVCLLPPKEGPCRALIPRWYYDRYTQTCQEFTYGGCQGNANNFRSLESCEKSCWMIRSKSSLALPLFRHRGPHPSIGHPGTSRLSCAVG